MPVRWRTTATTCASRSSAPAPTGADRHVADVAAVPGIARSSPLQLDFGVDAFPGANRFVEIGVKPAGTGSFTTLAPRQQISSSPYAIRTLSAATADALSSACVGCVTNAQIQGVAGSKVSGAIPAASDNERQHQLTFKTPARAGAELQHRRRPGCIGTNLTVGGALNANGSGLTNLNAGNITTGTLNNARLGLIPTANIADSAVTAPKLASGQVVKSLNTLKDDVTLAAGSNITITPAGTTLTIASTSGRHVGDNGSRLASHQCGRRRRRATLRITRSSEGVQLPNGVQLGVGAQGNQVRFGSPNGETGMTIQGASASGLTRQFRRHPGQLVSRGAGGFGTAVQSTNGLAITTAGNVGIGTTAPTSKLEIAAQDGLKISGFQPFLTLRDTNGGNRSSFVQGVNGDAALVTNSRATLIVKDISGNVGIGTVTPNTRLTLSGGPQWTSYLWDPSMLGFTKCFSHRLGGGKCFRSAIRNRAIHRRIVFLPHLRRIWTDSPSAKL